jgi:hypothetical protein
MLAAVVCSGRNSEVGKRWAFRCPEGAGRDAFAVWNIASVVPWLEGPFETGQQISDVVLAS